MIDESQNLHECFLAGVAEELVVEAIGASQTLKVMMFRILGFWVIQFNKDGELDLQVVKSRIFQAVWAGGFWRTV